MCGRIHIHLPDFFGVHMCSGNFPWVLTQQQPSPTKAPWILLHCDPLDLPAAKSSRDGPRDAKPPWNDPHRRCEGHQSRPLTQRPPGNGWKVVDWTEIGTNIAELGNKQHVHACSGYAWILCSFHYSFMKKRSKSSASVKRVDANLWRLDGSAISSVMMWWWISRATEISVS